MVLEYGLWNKTCLMPLYNPKTLGASVFPDKWGRLATKFQDVRFVRVSDWFAEHLTIEDQVYLKLNCEGAEINILDDLIGSGQYKKIDVAMVDFDIRKVPTKRHLAREMKARMNQLGIPKIFYTDELRPGKQTHSYFTHYWLDRANENN